MTKTPLSELSYWKESHFYLSVSYAALIVSQDDKPGNHTDNVIIYLNQPEELPKHTARLAWIYYVQFGAILKQHMIKMDTFEFK